MSDLVSDYQFALDGVRFGRGTAINVPPDGFTPGDGSLAVSINDHPTSHGSLLGRDFRRSANWGFDLQAMGDSAREALDITAALRDVWWNEDNEDTPGAVSELEYRLGGRTRLVYGRGRRWTPSPNNQLIGGVLPITADFEVIYPASFGPEQSITVSANGANQAVAGIEAPLESPLIGFGGGEPQASSITIGGETATWLTLEFHGGINPYVEIGGWRYELDGSVGGDEVVTADARPWTRGITSSMGGAFGATRTSRLAFVKLKPGQHSVTYGNLDFGTSASVLIRWRDAYKSL